MYEWTEEQEMVRGAVRQFIDKEIRPNIEEFEHGDTPPYDVLRKLFREFGMDSMARDRFAKQIAFEKEVAAAIERGETPPERTKKEGDGGSSSLTLIPIIELCRVCPGMVTAMGVSMGLTSAAISSKGTIAQKERWVPELLTLEKVGAWAITEPNSGSDAFGSMKSTARKDGDEYVLNGSKTFITNGPYADTIVFICKFDEGNDPADRKILSFVLDKGMPGLVQSKPLRKMGMHSSPTGELFLDDVRVPAENLLGAEGQGFVHLVHNLPQERLSIAAAAVAGAEAALGWTLEYVKERTAFGQPVGSFQNSRFKLAEMRTEIDLAQVFIDRCVEALNVDELTAEEAAEAKWWCTELHKRVVDTCVQLHGGYGYMLEYPIARAYADVRITTIYGGTTEIMKEIIGRSLGV